MALKCNMDPEKSREALRRFDLWLCGEEEDAARSCFDPILFYESLPGSRRRYWCTESRQTWEESKNRLGGKHKEKITCPFCQRAHRMLNVNKYSYGMSTLKEWIHAVFIHADEDGALLIAGGMLQRRFSWDELFGEIEWAPMKLYYMAPGEIQGWESGWYCGQDYRGWHTTKFVQEPFQPQMYTYDGSYVMIGMEQIERSAFRYCRYRDFYMALCQADPCDGPKEGRGFIRYLATYALFPSLEIAVRLGFYSAVEDLIWRGKKNHRLLNWNGKTPAEFMRASKADAKAFMSWNMDFDDLGVWRTMAKNVTLREFADTSGALGGTSAYEAAKACAELLEIPFKECVKYLRRMTDEQENPADKWKVVGMWADYISMGFQLGYDLKEKTAAMPRNLSERHDAAAKLIDYRKHEQEGVLYAARYARLVKKFSFSLGGLSVIVPANSEEIVREGKTLQHCVGGYAARHMEGKTVILFIRHSRRPERSFLTVELSTDRKPKLRQVHGYKNERYLKKGNWQAGYDPKKKYAWFLDAWLTWVNDGSKRDKQGNPIMKQEVKIA